MSKTLLGNIIYNRLLLKTLLDISFVFDTKIIVRKGGKI